MTRRSLLGAAIACLALASGCATLDREFTPGCKSANCPAEITITANSDGTCNIVSTTPNPLQIARNNAPVVVWTLKQPAPPAFKFASNGIAFSKTPLPPPGEFTALAVTQSTVTMKDNNHHNAKLRFEYDIHIVKNDGSRGCDYDPIVFNDGCDGCP